MKASGLENGPQAAAARAGRAVISGVQILRFVAAAMVLLRDHIRHANPSVSQVIGFFPFLPVPDSDGKDYPILIPGGTLDLEMLLYVFWANGLLCE